MVAHWSIAACSVVPDAVRMVTVVLVILDLFLFLRDSQYRLVLAFGKYIGPTQCAA